MVAVGSAENLLRSSAPMIGAKGSAPDGCTSELAIRSESVSAKAGSGSDMQYPSLQANFSYPNDTNFMSLRNSAWAAVTLQTDRVGWIERSEAHRSCRRMRVAGFTPLYRPTSLASR